MDKTQWEFLEIWLDQARDECLRNLQNDSATCRVLHIAERKHVYGPLFNSLKQG